MYSNGLKELKNDFHSFKKFVKTNKLNVVITLFFIFMAYGIKLFYYSISLDTDEILYNQNDTLKHWISIGRFGLVAIKKLFHFTAFNPYIACFLMICTMIVLCLSFGFVLTSLSGQNSNTEKVASSVFSVVFLTSPLLAEQFNFILQGFEVALGLLLSVLSLFFISQWIKNGKNYFYLIIGLIFMTFSFSCYQTIVFLYISEVIAAYLLLYHNSLVTVNQEKICFKSVAFKYAVTFLIGCSLYFLLNKLVSVLTGSSYYLIGMVLWGNSSNIECTKNIVKYIESSLLGREIFFNKSSFVIFLSFLVFAIIKFCKNQKNKFLIFAASMLLLASPYFLSVILGRALFPRMQFSLPFVLGFILYFFILNTKRAWLKKFIIFVALCISFIQSYRCARLFYTDYMVYQSEVALAGKISFRIDDLEVENIANCPVVLVGKLHPFDSPSKIRGDAIGYSFFEWDPIRSLMLMRTMGYNYKIPTQEEIEKANKIVSTTNVPAWPNKDSVLLKDNLVIVNFGLA